MFNTSHALLLACSQHVGFAASQLVLDVTGSVHLKIKHVPTYHSFFPSSNHCFIKSDATVQ